VASSSASESAEKSGSARSLSVETATLRP
jgi:hypothetical protein